MTSDVYVCSRMQDLDKPCTSKDLSKFYKVLDIKLLIPYLSRICQQFNQYLYLGTGRDKTRFPDRIRYMTPIQNLTENRIRHASGPVHKHHSVKCNHHITLVLKYLNAPSVLTHAPPSQRFSIIAHSSKSSPSPPRPGPKGQRLWNSLEF